MHENVLYEVVLQIGSAFHVALEDILSPVKILCEQSTAG